MVMALRWLRRRRSRNVLSLLLICALLGSFFPSFAVVYTTPEEVKTHSFRIYNDMFWKDNDLFRIIGGDLHYFRILPQYWEDRLLRAKSLGLNTIQTYVPWNLHEPYPEQWTFEGIADLESFLNRAHDLGFLVMIRAGPYICGEWDFGGFPAWLLAQKPALRLRSSDPGFLLLVERWWGILLPKIAPFLYSNGGPVIMVQIENEYGSYGDDKIYLQHLVALARQHLGDNTILYTTDGGTRETLDKGTILGHDVFAAVDFPTSDDPWPVFKLQKKYNAPGRSPPLCAEFYTGWLTHWGERIAKTDAASTAAALEAILSRNGSAVLYMAYGGTNFGFFSGANTGQNESDYKPDLTSYDYDAPIKEWGDVDNLKFKALRRVIEKYSGNPLPPVPRNNERRAYGYVMMQKITSLFDALDVICDLKEVIEADRPIAMESLGQFFGFVLYIADFHAKRKSSILSISKVHDRAQVFVLCMSDDNLGRPTYIGLIRRWSNRELTIPEIECVSKIRLFILVENMGRVNYGPYIYDRKGILSDVILDDSILNGWKMIPISLHSINKLREVNPILQLTHARPVNISKEPGFFEGRFVIDSMDQIKDTFISFSGWSKGVAFVNNHNIGRYWPSMGPQCNLYVPAPVLQYGENILVILELEDANPELALKLVDEPKFTCGSYTGL